MANWLENILRHIPQLYTDDGDNSTEARELLLKHQIPFIEFRNDFNTQLDDEWVLPALFTPEGYHYGLSDIKLFLVNVTGSLWVTIDEAQHSQEVLQLLDQAKILYVSGPTTDSPSAAKYPIIFLPDGQKLHGFHECHQWIVERQKAPAPA